MFISKRHTREKTIGQFIGHIPLHIYRPLSKKIILPETIYPPIQNTTKCDYEIFAYCSKNYQDAYEFVINSWTQFNNMKKVTLYTDWDLKPTKDKVEVINIFQESNDWLTGTGRRLDVIKHFSEKNLGQQKNVLFLDIDCYLVKDVSEIFNYDFDMAISRLHNNVGYANKTATAGLWFCKLTPGYYNFIKDWFTVATEFKNKKIGIQNHRISYVQYSFTQVAKQQTDKYKIFPIDEKIYNSEHSDLKKWYTIIEKYKSKILHFKGRRFRNLKIVQIALNTAGIK